MTYSLNIINRECCHLIQQDSEGKEIIQDITLKTFFETAQSLGFFQRGRILKTILALWFGLTELRKAFIVPMPQ